MRRIDNVLTTKQLDHKIFTFGLPANALKEFCQVERFECTPDGVNRQLNNSHMLEIAEAMSSKSANTLWLEPIIVALKGDWRYDESEHVLFATDGAYFSVDDGQHRVEALRSGLLTEEEIGQLNFTVTATLGLSYELRLRIFRMQAERRPIDARLDLAQRHRLGSWRRESDQEAYDLVLQLNSNPSSPLKGRVQLTEGDTRPKENDGGSSNLINAHGMYATFKTLFGRRSPLHNCLPAKRAEVITNTIRIASQVWPKAWNSDKHILTTARGINAILRLYVSGINFRSIVGMEFTTEKIRSGLEAGKLFDWESRKARRFSTEQIMERLDETIRRGSQGGSTKPKGRGASAANPQESAPASS